MSDADNQAHQPGIAIQGEQPHPAVVEALRLREALRQAQETIQQRDAEIEQLHQVYEEQLWRMAEMLTRMEAIIRQTYRAIRRAPGFI